MSLARSALLAISRSQWLARQAVQHGFARRAVLRFMPGESLDAALEASAVFARAGIGAVVTHLGENLTSLAEADAVREHYLGVFERIAERRLDCSPSVKPTQLGLDLSFDACLANLAILAARADAAGTLLWIDMEDSRYVDRTLDLFRLLRERYERVGVCLQAYLRRTPADLDALAPLRPAVRLVKGAYAEAAQVAFPSKRDVDAAYLRLGERLLELAARGGALPAFGTHDMRLVGRLASRAAELEVADGAWEVHMLYGIRSADQLALAAAGRAVRVLISHGSAWFPWYVRRLAERPANVWFVVRSLMR